MAIFTFEALFEETFEHFFTISTDGWAGVTVELEGVRDVDSCRHDTFNPWWTTSDRWRSLSASDLCIEILIF